MSNIKRRHWIGRLLVGFIKLNYLLPSKINYWLSLFVSKLASQLNTQSSRAIRDNISLCFPDFSIREQSDLVQKFLQQNAHMNKEFAVAWLGDRNRISKLIDNVIAEELIIDSQKKNKPVIIAVPHIGNWEFFWHWLQLNHAAISMYSPSKYDSVSELMLNARKRFGGKPHAADIGGMTKLLKGLKQNKIMMILPDQAPYPKSGIYSPFFGHPAYTMTLLHRLIQKTGAQLIFGASIRNKNNHFDICLEAPSFDSQTDNLEEFNKGLNRQIETIILKNPSQYLWSYKRFKRQPKDQGIYTY